MVVERSFYGEPTPVLAHPLLMAPCLSGGPRLLISTVMWHTTPQPPQAIFMQATPVLFPALASITRDSAPSPHLPQQTSISGWGMPLALFVQVPVCFALCKPVTTLCSEALKLPLCPGWSLSSEGTFLCVEPFSLSQFPPRSLPGAQVPVLIPFSLPFFLCPVQLYGDFSFALLEVWGLLPVDIQWGYSVKIFSRYSVRLVSHIFLIYLWEKVNSTSYSSAILTGSPTIPIFDEDVEQLAFSYSAARNVQWWSHFEKQFSSVLTS